MDKKNQVRGHYTAQLDPLEIQQHAAMKHSSIGNDLPLSQDVVLRKYKLGNVILQQHKPKLMIVKNFYNEYKKGPNRLVFFFVPNSINKINFYF